jgi:hypothetical protein
MNMKRLNGSWDRLVKRLARGVANIEESLPEDPKGRETEEGRYAVSLCARTGQVGVNPLLVGETMEEFGRRFEVEQLCPCGGCGTPAPASPETDDWDELYAMYLDEEPEDYGYGIHEGDAGPGMACVGQDCPVCNFLDYMEAAGFPEEPARVTYGWGIPVGYGDKPN